MKCIVLRLALLASLPASCMCLLNHPRGHKKPRKPQEKPHKKPLPAANDTSILPVYWLHIPKTGSSFATTIAHATCGGSIPKDVIVKEPTKFKKTWKARCPKELFLEFEAGHTPIHVTDPKELPHVALMQRSPSARVLSGYFAKPQRLHDCPRLQERYHCNHNGSCDGDIAKQGGARNVTNPSVIPPIEYADCVGACSAQMLSGVDCGSNTPANLTLALENLRQVGFVGLTEEWELSVCLWHVRFGGMPVFAELANTRPGLNKKQTGKEEKLLEGWHGAPDKVVYEAAKKRFWHELEKYDVSPDSCSMTLSSIIPANQRRKGYHYDED